MGHKQPMQAPALAAAGRRDKDDRTWRCAQHRSRDTAECARGQIGSNLRAHDDHRGLAFAGFLRDGGRGRARPLLHHEPLDLLR